MCGLDDIACPVLSKDYKAYTLQVTDKFAVFVRTLVTQVISSLALETSRSCFDEVWQFPRFFEQSVNTCYRRTQIAAQHS